MDSVHIQMKTTVSSPDPVLRSTYRHGDLRRALLEAGIELARSGGPEAVVLREATRRAGVVPNAAYRHFESRQALLRAVRAEALTAVALSMRAELALVPVKGAPARIARASVRAVGWGYLRFAQAEIGLFRTAFGPLLDDERGLMQGLETDDERRSMHPFGLLGAALDQLVAAGVLPAARRPGAEFLAWSAVHGLALLIIDGPLRNAPRDQLDRLCDQLLDMVEKGLS